MLPKQSGFTLIEIVIVVAIIGLLAVLALNTVNSGAPQRFLVTDALEVKNALMKARAIAVRDGHQVKLCYFRATAPGTATPGIRYIITECNDFGTTGCPNVPSVCKNVFADAGGPNPFFTVQSGNGTGVTIPPTFGGAAACAVPAASGFMGTSATAGAADGNWCLLANTDLTQNSHVTDHISINTFYDNNLVPIGAAPDVLEFTFLADGSGAFSNSQPYQVGYFDLTSYDQCMNGANASVPPGAACVRWAKHLYFKYQTSGTSMLVGQ